MLVSICCTLYVVFFVSLRILRPPRSTLTDTRFPYTTLFRSRQAGTGALLGSVIGIFFGIPGLLLGPFIGAVVGELMAQRRVERAAMVGAATWLGLLAGSIAKLALCLTMLLIFAFAWWL